MSVINGKTNHIQHSILQSVWGPMASGDTGTVEQLGRYTYHSVTMTGTIGDATVTLEGTDEAATASSYVTLVGTTATGTTAPISTTSLPARFDFVTVAENIRPKVTGTTGTGITVTVTSRSLGH